VKAIDLFAGFGGFTLGAEMADVEVVWAANHWQTAVDVHSKNHPNVAHSCQDLRQADWTSLPAFDLLLAAPACQGHSTASQPNRRVYHDAMRATAWAVVDCADVTEPRAIVVENVPSFLRWRLFPVWTEALSRLGYCVDTRRVVATDHDVPQRRERVSIICTRRPTMINLRRAATESPFGGCVDFGAGTWRPIASASVDAQQRMRRAQSRYGARVLSQHTTGHSGVPLTQAIRTITTKDQWVLVDGERYRPLLLREVARGMGFPDSYTWDEGLSREAVYRGLGNAVCPPVGRDVISAVREVA
jgi:DNA (cytosine-5)-methyltransferase 1